ncbi:DUF975 family protein [Liquorilactobacillus oeni]|uniref:Integral membrane protein n=1 Tax=Liquorilactobacillus oeni DSM 19972 TaxID=1423777 RepID=A0A0R1MJC8_9LACO|nr:DUF975 family protein [Liquorilactobacillus oeni]KRL05274.1 hypothetical protein FD46_GL000954 [Liquorilactobacillus oeni DSM 19972]
MKTRKELKAEVKQTFKGHWGQAVKLTIIPVILEIIVSIVVAGLFFALVWFLSNDGLSYLNSTGEGYNAAFNGDRNSFSGYLPGFLVTMIMIGINFTFLDWLRTKKSDFKVLKGAFSVFTKRHFVSVLVLYVLVSLFTFLWMLLFIIPGIIKSYSYSQTYLIYKDLAESKQSTEDISYLDYITKSRNLMNGHKLDLFLLQLSFLGWSILAVLSFGIGFIWLTPYKTATYVAFYKDIAQDRFLGSDSGKQTTDNDGSFVVRY